MFRGGLLQAVHYAALGAGVPFLSLYLKRTLVMPAGGPALAPIGVVLFLNAVVGIASASLAGYLADRFQVGNRLLAILSVLVALAMTAVALPAMMLGWVLTTRVSVVAVAFTAAGLFQRPIAPLIDSECLEAVRAGHGGPDRYGRLRLWGSVGWIAAAAAVGWLVDERLAVPVLAYAGGFAVLAGVAARGVTSTVRAVRIPWAHLLGDHMFRRHLIFVFLMLLGNTSSFLFTAYFLDDARLSPGLIGLSFALGAVGELPVLYWSDRLIRRIGNRGMITAGAAVTTIKLVLFVLFSGGGSAAALVLAQLLMGPGFVLLYAGIVDLADRRAHPHLRATYQNLTHVASTMAQAAGGLLAPAVLAASGSRGLMTGAAALVAAAAAYFLLFVRGHGPQAQAGVPAE